MFTIRRVDDRVATRLLIAAGDECVERQRIRVGNGSFFFNENAEHACFEKRGERYHPFILN